MGNWCDVQWPMTIYLAGKIAKGDWRHKVVTGLREAVSEPCPVGGGDDDYIKHWRPLDRAIMGVHHYAGPFFINCDHGCFHGEDQHGVAAQAEEPGSHGEPRRQRRTVSLCKAAIESCDLMFAWVDALDCYGTVTEIGYAVAMGKIVVVAGPKRFRDMWFVYEIADETMLWKGTPESALETCLPIARKRLGGKLTGDGWHIPRLSGW